MLIGIVFMVVLVVLLAVGCADGERGEAVVTARRALEQSAKASAVAAAKAAADAEFKARMVTYYGAATVSASDRAEAKAYAAAAARRGWGG